MHRSNKRTTASLGLRLAVGAVSFAALAGVAHAEGLRLAVGDLAQPGQAAAFAGRLDAAAKTVCQSQGITPRLLGSWTPCLEAVRTEVLDGLTAAQRQQLADASARPVHLASAGR